jgi:hypothetical protein
MGCDGTRGLGPEGDPGLSEARDNFLTRSAEKGTRCAVGGARQQRSVPLALASLVLGPRGAFSRFFEISRWRFEISIRRPEAHFGRRGPIWTTASLLL